MKFNCLAKQKKSFSPRSSPTQGMAKPAVSSSMDHASIALGCSQHHLHLSIYCATSLHIATSSLPCPSFIFDLHP